MTPTIGRSASSISSARRAARSASRTSGASAWISATSGSCRTCWRSPSAAIVDFPNNDRTYHNVFSLSDVRSVRSRALRRGPVEGRAIRSARHRARVLRHPLAHERVHPGVRAPLLRRHRRGGPLPDRQRAARRLHGRDVARGVGRRGPSGHRAGERRRNRSDTSRPGKSSATPRQKAVRLAVAAMAAVALHVLCSPR